MKDIPNYEGLYAATQDGHIWSYKTNQFLSEHDIKGYFYVHLITDVDKSIPVHRLIALTFFR